LDRYPFPVQLELDFPTFHDFEDAYQARWPVIQMHFQGWNPKSIGGLLKLSHQHVGRILAAFEQDGFAALEDQRTRPVNHPHNQLTLPFIKEVLDLQHEYPRAGEFRLHGMLEKRSDEAVPSERTVGRAMAINRKFHRAPGPWQSDKKEVEPEATPKYLPYRPHYRHQMWFVDVRYLVRLEDRWVYSLCVIEGHSRTILAGMASEHQDLAAVWQILYAALSQYGCPDLIVSDNAGVFTSPQTQHILAELQIEPKYIEKGKPWQNLIESQFKIQLRLADYKFETAQTFEEIQAYHAEFIETFNTTPHWGHKERADGRRVPIEVLAWVRGREVDLGKLQHLFQAIRFDRTINRYGFVSIQRYYLYAEQGLSRKRVSIWIYEGKLRIEYQQTMLAKYACEYDPHQKQLQKVSQPTLFQTPFKSPQLVLLELDDLQWLKIRHRMYHRQQKRFAKLGQQLPLRQLDVAI
jgi:transposase InsO family protein